VADWFGATPEEQGELLRAIEAAKQAIEAKHAPDGYNIGINVGPAAGQTVFHVHVHVIPRYRGDVADPRGGVRYVIPERANYLARTPSPSTARPDVSLLIRGGEDDPLLPHLLALLAEAESVAIATAFTLPSGVRLVEEHLRDVLARGGRVRLLTGDSLGITDPAALLRLLDLQAEAEPSNAFELRIYESGGCSFHPKAYIVTRADGEGAAFVGSSDLTETALRRGVEWNYRVVPSRDSAGFAEVVDGFEALWRHPRTRALDAAWVRAYAARRTVVPAADTGVAPEVLEPPPVPHPLQQAALSALEQTRAAGNRAGLVVLATGLGKTWLSAFDSYRPEFPRVLFIAHREEILTQAMRTFRRIRPTATLGLYTGREKAPEADVLFASIQTLARAHHLHRFGPEHFDYVVVDEFHHAAARTYRRVLDYLEPKFLLGLTATPERTDGGDLLSLCGSNLVFRRDLHDGIRLGLLSPFDYYGVPDQVDYRNIPWRSSRFDEEALTAAVATQARAQNALDQYRTLGGRRTLGFCVSQRHADFMAEYFRDSGVRAVAVHSGPTSAPRALSLEQLEAGGLEVIFAVDMFNEGVDLPSVDTVLMLRPTESRVIWLQQFGRGLRRQEGKRLRVIDYIGNHRVFLTKIRALFGLGAGDVEVRRVLNLLETAEVALPPGCSVTYDLEAKEILRSLLRSAPPGEQLRLYYEEFREQHGARPLAAEAFQDGYDPGAARRSGHAGWLAFVQAMDGLSAAEAEVLERFGAFLGQLEVTPMTRSYKMLVLLAMLAEDAFPGVIPIERLTHRFGELIGRWGALRVEVGRALEDPAALRKLIESNPVAAWTGGRGTGGTAYFRYADDQFSTTFDVAEELRGPLRDLVREIVDWRLTAYVRRAGTAGGAERIVTKVSHTNGRPMLFLPDRSRHPSIPEGWQDVLVDGQQLQANFVKIAVNVVRRPGSTENLLPEILHGWFGPEAGQPGRTHTVVFERGDNAYAIVPTPVGGGEVAPQGSPEPRIDHSGSGEGAR
jgi:superfamily II DNA or RNA helicase/HKD family nuclease